MLKKVCFVILLLFTTSGCMWKTGEFGTASTIDLPQLRNNQANKTYVSIEHRDCKGSFFGPARINNDDLIKSAIIDAHQKGFAGNVLINTSIKKAYISYILYDRVCKIISGNLVTLDELKKHI